MPVAKLRAVSSRIEQALATNAVDEQLKAYYETLLSRTPPGWLYAGFKLLRPDEARVSSEGTGPAASLEGPGGSAAAAEPHEKSPADADDHEPVLYWFFFPLNGERGAATPANVVAWESSSKSGRATYLFRLVDPAQTSSLAHPARAQATVEAAIHELNRAIGLLNFRREPIYLSDDDLALDPRYRRYAIACRKLPELRRLRASFLGRAIHTSPEAWQKQLETFLG